MHWQYWVPRTFWMCLYSEATMSFIYFLNARMDPNKAAERRKKKNYYAQIRKDEESKVCLFFFLSFQVLMMYFILFRFSAIFCWCSYYQWYTTFCESQRGFYCLPKQTYDVSPLCEAWTFYRISFWSILVKGGKQSTLFLLLVLSTKAGINFWNAYLPTYCILIFFWDDCFGPRMITPFCH